MKYVALLFILGALTACSGPTQVGQALQAFQGRPHCNEGWLPTNNGPYFDWAAFNQNQINSMYCP